MNLTSTSFSGLPTNILSQVEQNLQIPVSWEFHAFCHLCLPDAPAATKLLQLSKDKLSDWSRLCKEAIDQWCCSARNYEAQPDGPSLTHQSSTLIIKTKERDGHCVITQKASNACHGAHILPYSLGKSQEKAKQDIWKVLEMFWGRERKDQLMELIFGSEVGRSSNSKTQINALYNMITLSPEVHINWGLGLFTLESLETELNPYELRAKFQWVPKKSESPMELRIATDPTNIRLIPLGIDYSMYNMYGLPITDGHKVTFTTEDLSNAPLPHQDLLMLQFFLIRVLRMAGRTGEDMLETFDSDDEVSLLAASNAGPTEEQTANELTRSSPCHNGTTDLETSPPTPSPDLDNGGATFVEQPAPKKRQNPFSSTFLRRLLVSLRGKIG